jgi:hypothetical protein
MATSGPENSPTKPSTGSAEDLRIAGVNTARGLEALGRKGEAGLQEDLDRQWWEEYRKSVSQMPIPENAAPPADPGFHEEDLPGGFGRVLILHDSSLSNSPASPTPRSPKVRRRRRKARSG